MSPRAPQVSFSVRPDPDKWEPFHECPACATLLAPSTTGCPVCVKIAAVIAAEREACAKIAEQMGENPQLSSGKAYASRSIAAAIRARPVVK